MAWRLPKPCHVVATATCNKGSYQATGWSRPSGVPPQARRPCLAEGLPTDEGGPPYLDDSVCDYDDLGDANSSPQNFTLKNLQPAMFATKSSRPGIGSAKEVVMARFLSRQKTLLLTLLIALAAVTFALTNSKASPASATQQAEPVSHWEYQIKVAKSPEALVAEANQGGGESWEMVSAVHVLNTNRYQWVGFFKRLKQ